MIRVQNISKRFGIITALHNVSVTFPAGKISALIGPNGSGKTTLIKIILGLVRPDTGDVFVADERVNSSPFYRQKIGYMPQVANFPENLTVREIIQMMKDIRTHPCRYDEELYTAFELEKEEAKRCKHLSGGNRQKLNAYLTFLFDPQIYILDEPTAGLDPIATVTLKKKIAAAKEQGKTFLLTSHILPEVEELADYIVFLVDGRILFSIEKSSLIEQYGYLSLEKIVAQIMRERQ